MTLDEAIKQIKKYMQKREGIYPLLVNVENKEAYNQLLKELKLLYTSGTYSFLTPADYCKKDQFIVTSSKRHMLKNTSNPAFLIGFVTLLKLQGKEVLTRQIKELLCSSREYPLVIIGYQSEPNLYVENDLRIKTRIISISGIKDNIPKIIFRETPITSLEVIIGVENIPRALTDMKNSKSEINVITTQTPLPTSMLCITKISRGYAELCNTYSEYSNLLETLGTTEQWQYLYKQLADYRNTSNLFRQKFGTNDNFKNSLIQYKQLTSEEKWLFFIACKMNRDPSNQYFSKVVETCTSSEKFIESLWRYLLELDYRMPGFKELYKQRKELVKLLKDLTNSKTCLHQYIAEAEGKGLESFYYLTDNSEDEKLAIIKLLVTYRENFTDKQQIIDILVDIYPDLANYLRTYQFKEDFLTEYFAQYTLCKITNNITPRMYELVENQALEREYNILPYRGSIVDSLDISNSILFFMDGMGVEFLSYIETKCQEADIGCTIRYGTAKLPSITMMNKDFLEVFLAKNIPIVDVKDIDDLKHEGIKRIEVIREELPIHLAEELRIIEEKINETKKYLDLKKANTVFWIADHGATRLAIVNGQELKYETETKGEHSGRCCKISELDTKPDCATQENGYWVLANYARFKNRSRKANVEAHGGATLEEVVVPIIEFYTKNNDKSIFLKLQNETPLKVSYKQSAILRINTTAKLSYVEINGKKYDATIENESLYIVKTDITKAGNFTAIIYDKKCHQIGELSFNTVRKGISNNQMGL